MLVHELLGAMRRCPHQGRPVLLMTFFVMISVSVASAQSQSLVISQVYGGGGDTGAPHYNQDFIELYNRGTTVIDLTTWSVQYAEATGTDWAKLDLTGTILPGQYVLVGGAIGTVGDSLPVAPDVSGSFDLNSTTGKVAVVDSQNILLAQACFDQGFSGVVDLVGYGPGADGTNCYEVAAAPALTEGLAIYRALGGCQDTNNNATDFIADAPQPSNSGSPLNENCVPTGACCTNNVCSISTQADCAGTYFGDFSICGNPVFSGGVASNSPMVDISTTGAPGPAQGHNVLSDAIDLPFPFFFFDATHTQFKYSTNGWLTFDLTQTDSAPNNPPSLPDPGSPNLLIAGFWDELVSDTSGPNQIFMQTFGEAPNRQFVIQYNNVLKFNTATRYTIQITLYEAPDPFGRGRVDFRYGAYVVPAAGDAVTGMEDIAGQFARNRPPNAITPNSLFFVAASDVGRCQSGSCCAGPTCRVMNRASCQFIAGVFDIGEICTPNPCSNGACCLNNGTCQILSPAACAMQSGTYRGDGSDCQSPCPPVGACCTGDGSGLCNIRSQEFCEAGGGSWAGPGSTCTPGLCTGACCLSNGTCADSSITNCQNAGGAFHGIGSACATLNPPCPPAGACCVPDGSGCSMKTEASCLVQGGIWDGPGSNCNFGACRGACCLPEGYCLVDYNRSLCQSNGGTFHGVHVACDEVNPPCPSAQLCCKPDGSCANLTAGVCIAQGGTPGGEGTRCDQAVYNYVAITPDYVDVSGTGTHLIGTGHDDVDAAFEIGFPFYFNTGCQPKTSGRVGSNGLIVFNGPATDYNSGSIPHWEAPNDAIYVLWDDLYTSGGGVFAQTIGEAPNRVCIVQWKNHDLRDNPNPNDPISFECKLFESANVIEFHYLHLRTPRSATSGVENAAGNVATQIPDSTIGNGPSAFRLSLPRDGACCLPDGACENMWQSVCNNLGGVFRGDDTTCETLESPCDPFGACCRGDGSGICDLRTEAVCAVQNGLWNGPGTDCADNPCAGACCIPGGACQMTGPIPCFSQGGVFFGTSSHCDTLNPPCSEMGACCSGGDCELRWDFNCGTFFRGPGITCDGPDACSQTFATLSGQATGCPGEAYTITVSIIGGNTAPYTVTLDNGGGTQTGDSPLVFTVTPTVTTTYAIAAAFDSLNQPIASSESVEIFIPTTPDCNTDGVVDWCQLPGVDEFVDALLGIGDPTNHCLADLNLNGQINGQDLSIFVDLLLN